MIPFRVAAVVLCLNLVTLFFSCPAFAWQHNGQKSDIPDFTAGDTIPEGHSHTWNLGPTGARGWIYSNRMETTEARQILITEVAPDSPANQVLQDGDIILGVAGQEFQFDPRTELGKAITKAEAQSGLLKVLRWRDGQTEDVVIQLPVLGQYSATAPFDCGKSAAIFRHGCDQLAKKMTARPNDGNRIVQAYNTLALLASGRDEFMPLIRTQVAKAAAFSDVEGRSLCCWFYGPTNLLLAEYTLATGDRTYFDDLQRITMEIVDGQSDVGSWGHRFARTDGRLNGYGMMNAPGLPLTLSLILARKAGVSDPRLDQAIDRSVRLMRFYVGKGCVPYGDHAPWLETHDDNGKNGIAAVMFNVLEDAPAAEYFSHMSVASHGAEREMGHTGNFFNLLWAMPGVAVSGPNATGQWIKEYGWYYDLARQWDGTYRHQGPAQPGTDSYKNWDSTGAYLLAYAQPLRKLYITGKQIGVANQIDADQAISLIEDGNGYSHRLKNEIYAQLDTKELFERLGSWSPVVRQRAATQLAQRDGDFVSDLVTMLDQDYHQQLGSCVALAKLGQKRKSEVTNAAVSALRATLRSEDLWLRIRAAEALAAIGKPANAAIADLLHLTQQVDLQNDPRGMQQRYLCFALFNSRTGMLRASMDSVDVDSLYEAIRSGLQNEDGRARSDIASIYKQLSYDQIEPLLPVVYQSVVEPAPSGIMFADGIRLAGLRVLAEHGIKEGVPLCLSVIEMDRWSAAKRLPKCLDAIDIYGAAAAELAPALNDLLKQLESKKRPSAQDAKNIQRLKKTIEKIQAGGEAVELRSLTEIAG